MRSYLHKLKLIIATLAHLQLTQLFFLFYRRILPSNLNLARKIPVWNQSFNLMPIIYNEAPRRINGGFNFINRYVEWSLASPDWEKKSESPLWRYNLHYFDWLKDSDLQVEWKTASILSWIERFPKPVSPAWDPYTTSLRLVNWLKYLAFHSSECTPVIQKSIFLQACWLRQNLEKDIRANHLLKNYVALVFAYYAFNKYPHFQFSLAKLKCQLDEQFLPCGAHYERSPMYHAICLEDLLDLLNLINANQQCASQNEVALIERLSAVAGKGLKFLFQLQLPDGEIPLLNDSAWAAAPSFQALHQYASCLQLPVTLTEASVNHLEDVGIFLHKHRKDALVMDCGAIAPAFQPGHAHAAMGSFEWVVSGERVIVDTGVYDYSTAEKRAYARSTAAHNTLTIDGQNQSQLWSHFRVGRRAKLLNTSLTHLNGGYQFMLAYAPVLEEKSLTVSRTIEFNGDCEWQVVDLVSGSGEHLLESRLHFSVYHKIVIKSGYAEVYTLDDQLKAQIQFDSQLACDLESAEWYPMFNVAERIPVLKFSVRTQLPFKLRIKLIKL